MTDPAVTYHLKAIQGTLQRQNEILASIAGWLELLVQDDRMSAALEALAERMPTPPTGGSDAVNS